MISKQMLGEINFRSLAFVLKLMNFELTICLNETLNPFRWPILDWEHVAALIDRMMQFYKYCSWKFQRIKKQLWFTSRI